MAFIDDNVGIGVRVAVIIGIIALIIVIFMREDGDRTKCDPILDDPGRRTQTVETNVDPFHPVIPTPTPPRPSSRPY